MFALPLIILFLFFFTRDEPKEPCCQSGLCSGSTREEKRRVSEKRRAKRNSERERERERESRNECSSCLCFFSILYFPGKATALLSSHLVTRTDAFILSFFFSPFRLQLQSEIGFGKLDSYTKLDKLGEVRRKLAMPITCVMLFVYLE